MKKFIFSCLVMATILSASAMASDAVISNTNCEIAKNSNLSISFDIENASNAVAVVSSFDDNGRILESKIVSIPSQNTYSAEFANFDTVNYVKINLFSKMDSLKPLCEHSIVDNHIEKDDSFISVAPLFKIN